MWIKLLTVCLLHSVVLLTAQDNDTTTDDEFKDDYQVSTGLKDDLKAYTTYQTELSGNKEYHITKKLTESSTEKPADLDIGETVHGGPPHEDADRLSAKRRDLSEQNGPNSTAEPLLSQNNTTLDLNSNKSVESFNRTYVLHDWQQVPGSSENVTIVGTITNEVSDKVTTVSTTPVRQTRVRTTTPSLASILTTVIANSADNHETTFGNAATARNISQTVHGAAAHPVMRNVHNSSKFSSDNLNDYDNDISDERIKPTASSHTDEHSTEDSLVYSSFTESTADEVHTELVKSVSNADVDTVSNADMDSVANVDGYSVSNPEVKSFANSEMDSVGSYYYEANSHIYGHINVNIQQATTSSTAHAMQGLIWENEAYLMTVVVPVLGGMAGALIFVCLIYVVKNCHLPQIGSVFSSDKANLLSEYQDFDI